MTTVQILMLVFGVIGTIVSGLLVWGLKALITATIKNAFQLQVLNGHIESLNKSHEKINQLEKDVNAIGKKLRGDTNGKD